MLIITMIIGTEWSDVYLRYNKFKKIVVLFIENYCEIMIRIHKNTYYKYRINM